MARSCLRKDHCICSLFQYCLSLFQYLPQHLPLATTSPFWKRCWRGAGPYLLFARPEVQHVAVYLFLCQYWWAQALLRAPLWVWWLHWCSHTCVLHWCPMPPCFPASAGHYSGCAHGCSPGVCWWWLSLILSLFHQQQPDEDDKTDQARDPVLKLLWFLSRGWVRWHPEVLFDLNVLVVLCFHGGGGTQFLLDIIVLFKFCLQLVPCKCLLRSSWSQGCPQLPLTVPSLFAQLWLRPQAQLLTFSLPVSVAHRAGDRLSDYSDLWSDPLHLNQACCHV